MICYLYPPPELLFFSPDIPPLLYYSHIPTAAVALLVGLFVFFNNPKNLANRLLLFISLSFVTWVIGSLIAWTNINSELLLFIWPLFGVTAGLISVLSIYFTYAFLYKKDVTNPVKIIFLVALLPILLFASTDLSVSGFDLAACDAFGYEGLLYKAYYTALSYIAMIWIFGLAVRRYRQSDTENRTQILLFTTGIEFFLFSFITTTSLVSYLSSLGFIDDSRYELYSLFSMAIFMTLLSILIVRFKAFNISLIAPQALVIALVILVGSQFTYVDNITAAILSGITLTLVGAVGIILIRSVKREIEQKKQLESLTVRLEKANQRLKQLDKAKSEFLSIASHQLRSPLAAIRGYASMMIEGSFGSFPDKAKQALERIDESSKLMADSIEDYLNVSRIESGNMKYSNTDFNLKDAAEAITDELRPVATKQGLLLSFKSDVSSKCIVNADKGKVHQAIHNLINNSIKYTQKGSITVSVGEHISDKKIWVKIEDTGVGMSKETQNKLFEKFSRADNAHQVNISGTGLGLYVAKQMIEHMGGTITAESEGEGQGSTFTITLPLQQ